MKKYNKSNINNFISETNIKVKRKLPVDIAFLGLGSDGHTASLFSDDEDYENENPYYFIDKKLGYDRITLSMKLLIDIKNINFLVSGSTKKNALLELMKEKSEKRISPAKYLIDKSSGEINIYSDIKL